MKILFTVYLQMKLDTGWRDLVEVFMVSLSAAIFGEDSNLRIEIAETAVVF